MARLLGLIALMVGAAVALLLFVGKSQRDVQTVTGFRLEVAENARPLSVDWGEAERAVASLEGMVTRPQIDHRELERWATRAASWVAGSQPGSPEYRLAVALRAACFALFQAGPALEASQRQAARRHLANARAVLAGEASGGPTRAITDQLTNLQVQHGEQLQQVERESP